MITDLINLLEVEKKLKKSFGSLENIFYFCNPKSREMEAQETVNRTYRNDFRVMKKNFKKVLVVWKKLFTFALANQGQQ